MNKQYLLILLTTALIITGCEQKLTAEQEAQKQQLINESIHNMVFIDGGTFLMGDFGSGHDGKSTLPYSLGKDDKYVHNVTLDSFSLSKYRVTWQQFNLWRELTFQSPTKTYQELKVEKYIKKWQESTQDNYPASVDWQDAKDYCVWLGQQAHLPIDLPTEAQWEYAARDRGKFILFASKDGTYNDGIDEDANKNKEKLFSAGFYPVGSYPPTPLGLYDMMGNGVDWVNDWYAEDYYQHSPAKNPQGPDNGENKVIRGSKSSFYLDTLTINREFNTINLTGMPGFGFRCAVQSPTPISKTEAAQ
ncbi:formylglycine-generating enzyme family protein [Providencia burhodogranariea]|uniref:Sulfatase-modifying factor enzyme-like domain-containing protein n=1 Tax=Providencia burhodogranariea DSM 19968 TaxID=1141662 RepID=K8WFA5_9GAMM|nr:hypothetical protein OOA_15352 [Providencia burhodogranariea DSM 19968]